MIQHLGHIQHLAQVFAPLPSMIRGLPYTGNLVVDYWAQDLDGQADGSAIGSWTDGISGLAATASGTVRPALKKLWMGGASYVQFDGVNDLLLTPSFLNSTFDKAFTLVMSRDYNGAEPSASLLNIFASNNAGSNSWLGQYDRANAAIALGNVTSGYEVPASNGPAVEILSFDGTTITHRHNGVVHAASASGNLGLSGNLAMGGYEGGSFIQAGYLRRLLIYRQALPAAVLATLEQTLYSDAGMRGRKLNYFLGDSQTLGLNATLANGYPAYVAHSIGTAQTYTKNGVSSRTLADMYAHYDDEIRPSLLSSLQNRVAVRAGTNDLFFGATGANTYNNALVPLCARLRADGAKIICVTCMKRTDSGTPAGFETQRAAYNALITGTPALFDGIVDVGNATLYPEFADSTNATYFVDLVHNTDAGNSIVATGNGSDGGVAAALNAL